MAKSISVRNHRPAKNRKTAVTTVPVAKIIDQTGRDVMANLVIHPAP
jgi:hypothetical protein